MDGNKTILIALPTWEGSIKWYENHQHLIVDEINNGALDNTFSKKCINAYVNSKAHDPMFITRKMRINCI